MSERVFRTAGDLDVDPELDLGSCHTDPIHRTGSIQSHGALLELDPESARVLSASTNVEGFIGRSTADLLGRRIDTLLGNRGIEHVQRVSRSEGTSREQLVREVSDERLLFTFFPIGDTTGVEIEPLRSVQGAPEELMADALVLVERLRGRTFREELFEATVRAVRSVSGFDRVMLYRFDEEGHGSVVAEVVRPGMVSYRDHRFPASDIPEPARRPYRKNRIRYVPDVGYDEVPIVGPEGERDRWGLDLTYCSLRGVSAVHRKYLENMDVGASCSFSLLVEGELWGLIACHGARPSHVDWPRRSICAQIAHTTSQQLERIRGEERDRRLRAVDDLRSRVELPSETGELFELLEANRDELLSFLDARYFFLRLDDEMLWIGSDGELETAPDGLVQHLSSRLEEGKRAEVRSIVGEVDEAWAHSKQICGYLVVRLGSSPRRLCAWFRPEERETIEWGGNPRHPARSDNGGLLSPRDSFETWTQIVTDRCLAWTEMDRLSAREFAQLLGELIIEVQADRLRRVNQKLEKLARTDDLTELANRREVHRRLDVEVERARRYGSPLSAVILDLDHFKAVNDRYGHQTGDRVLKRVGRLLRDGVRSADIVGRYGGEEFAIVLPETGTEEAMDLIGRILEGVRELSIEADGETVGITSSAGVATLLDAEESPSELIRRADAALYRAKEKGRDRVVAD